jgi:hypothetical protein
MALVARDPAMRRSVSRKAAGSYKTKGNAPGFVAPKARLELQPQQIFKLSADRRETTDEELELIEMRYQQMLAIENLEDLFAEGRLDCMRSVGQSRPHP